MLALNPTVSEYCWFSVAQNCASAAPILYLFFSVRARQPSFVAAGSLYPNPIGACMNFEADREAQHSGPRQDAGKKDPQERA